MISRREVIAGGVMMALSARSGLASADAAPSVVLRRSIGSMMSNDPDLQAYIKAVTIMKGLPQSDPKNWIAQANIHTKWCPHKNWYFLPWHRAYLVAFERICRALSGKSDFALPYWDWTVDRQLPAAFSSGTPQSNVLNDLRPGFSSTDSLPDDMVGQDVINGILNSPDYESFGSTRPNGQNSTAPQWQRRIGAENELEYNPHDGVHGTLNGDMGQVALSPRDPIFWLHHCNLDRIWSNWNDRGHKNSTDKNWTDFGFNNQFYNADGSFWDAKVSDVFSTEALGYHYGAQVPAAPVNQTLLLNLQNFRTESQSLFTQASDTLKPFTLPNGAIVRLAAAENSSSATSQRPLSIPITLGQSITDTIRLPQLSPSGSQPVSAEPPSQRVIASLTGIRPPKDARTRVRIFVNCDYLSPQTPLSDPHYVTSFSFFGDQMEGMDQEQGFTISADITAALSKVARSQRLQGDQLIVQLLSSSPNKEAGPTEVRPRTVQIAVL